MHVDQYGEEGMNEFEVVDKSGQTIWFRETPPGLNGAHGISDRFDPGRCLDLDLDADPSCPDSSSYGRDDGASSLRLSVSGMAVRRSIAKSGSRNLLPVERRCDCLGGCCVAPADQ